MCSIITHYLILFYFLCMNRLSPSRWRFSNLALRWLEPRGPIPSSIESEIADEQVASNTGTGKN